MLLTAVGVPMIPDRVNSKGRFINIIINRLPMMADRINNNSRRTNDSRSC